VRNRNGPFIIEVRAFDGQNYSDVRSVTVIADNPATGGGLLPGFDLTAAAIAFGAFAVVVRLRGRRGLN